jgi:large repetitive protein
VRPALPQCGRGAGACALAAVLAACAGGGGSNGGGGGNPSSPPAIHITTASLIDGTVGVPYTQTITTSGGTGARSFAISAGGLPAGVTLQTATGVIAGTPAGPAGTANFTVSVEDSASPAQTARRALGITVNAVAVGRNDRIESATPVGNGTFAASISPSGDPGTVFAPDEDYYAVTTTATSTITVDIDAQVNGSPLDSVIELLDSRGNVLNLCGSPAFNSQCISDDEVLGVQLDSLLQLRVNGATTFYVHVVDWGGDARPDKLYDLVISGVR